MGAFLPASTSLGAGPSAAGAPQALRILSDRALPAPLQPAVDLRWANDGSADFALAKAGTVQASLEPLGGSVKELIPGAMQPDGFWASARIGVSPEYLAVAGPAFALTWRKVGIPLRKEIDFDVIEDIDVGGRRLAVLGTRRDAKKGAAPDGAIVWTGSLDKDLTDLRPLLYDQRGAGAPSFNNCINFELGSVRFLPGGELVVVPGVQAGAFLYDSQGRLMRTWDTVSLGLDNDCPGLSRDGAARLQFPDSRIAWLNQRRTLEDILPLPEGPGLLVRSVSQGRPSWELKVLDRNGPGHATYAIPISPVNERSHLRGDVRNGRILLLMTTLDQTFVKTIRGHLIVAEIPPAKR